MLQVCRTSDKVMAVRILWSDNARTIVSAYAPQVGCDEDTTNAFWNELEAVIMNAQRKEKLVLASDLNELVELAIVNTFYSKRREHLLTYKRGGNATVIDYFMVRRDNLRELKICKVIPGESVAT